MPWFFRGKKARPLPARPMAHGDQTASQQRNHLKIDQLLDVICGQFAAADRVVAEVMLPIRDRQQLLTIAVRPKEAPLLFARLRSGRGLGWRALRTGQQQSFQDGDTASRSAADQAGAMTRLASSRSALSIPLQHNGAVAGVLNLESPSAHALTADTIQQLQRSGALAELAREVATVRSDGEFETQVSDYLLEKMSDRIAYAISPDDMAETYAQILSVSVSVVKPADASAGLILVYNRTQELTARGDIGPRYAVRAARFGAFDSKVEWEWTGKSIARRIMENRKGELIPDAQQDPDYRDSGTQQERTAELIVPLIAKGAAWSDGVIGLVTSQDDNFDSAHDLARMEQVAEIAAYAIHRSEEYKLGRRRSLQQRCAVQLQEVLAPLFPLTLGEVANGDTTTQVTDSLIKDVRQQVGDRILEWALQYANAQHGAFVLLQAIPELDATFTHEEITPQLIMTDRRTDGQINESMFVPGELPRWLPNEGYSGQAFQRGRTLVVADVYAGEGWEGEGKIAAPEHYIPFFLNAKSEVATPLIIGNTKLGVLDVESDEKDHFTSDHVEWIEFLARQAAFALSVIEHASKTRVELAMAGLSDRVDGAITNIRLNTTDPSIDPATRVNIIQTERRNTLNLIIEHMRELTGAWVGRFLVELNAYGAHDAIDNVRGRLYYSASSDSKETDNVDERFFEFGRGVSSVAFLTRQRIVFNSEKKRHPQYFDSDPTRKSLSGIFVPVIEGTRVTGVLNLECEKDGVFTPELIQACEQAGNLISKLMTGCRLRIDRILGELLRAFDFDIMRLPTSDLLTFIDLAIKNAARLSLVNERAGWGELVLLRQDTSAGQWSEDQRYWHDFSMPGNATEEVTGASGQPVTYPLYLEAIRDQRPVVLLDRRIEPAAEQVGEPWHGEARAVIVVPLLGPSLTHDTSEVLGMLALAHPEPANYSDHDKVSLGLFAESIVYGLKTIALMQSRAHLMRQLRFDTQRAGTPALLAADAVLDALDDAERAPTFEKSRPHLDEIRQATKRSVQLASVGQHITTWFLDLVDDDLAPDLEQRASQPAERILADFQIPANILAGAIYSKTVTWKNAIASDVPLLGGEEAARLIRAILAQYLEVPLHDEHVKQIEVRAELSPTNATFSVAYSGATYSKEQQSRLFTSGATPSTLASQQSTVTAEQQGLFQVKRIADRLQWQAYYIGDDAQEMANAFVLDVPLT